MLNEEKEQQKKKQIHRIAQIVLAGIAIVCILYLVVHTVRQAMIQRQYEQMSQESVVVQAEVTEQIEAQIYGPVPKVDFDTLWQTNEDICAWIYIPDTKVSYPVLRKQDAENPYDDYYLSHTAEGQNGLPGSIYVEPCNAGDFSDNNTVVYVHYLKNGTMFGSLHEYQDESYMEKHPYVYVITPERERVYQVFAAIAYDDRHLMGSFASFTEPEEREAFLSSLKENGDETDVIREDIAVTADSKLLTLSTCIKNQSEKRLLVEAVQVYERET